MSPESASLTDGVLVALRRIARTIDLRSRALMKRYGLTVPQLLVLRELDQRGEGTGSALARAVSLSPATVTGILKRLESRQLVVRYRSDVDRRKVVVALGEAGRTLVAEAPSPLQSGFCRRYEALADWEQSLILSSLQRLVALLEAETTEAGPYLATGAADAPALGTDSAEGARPHLDGAVPEQPELLDAASRPGSEG